MAHINGLLDIVVFSEPATAWRLSFYLVRQSWSIGDPAFMTHSDSLSFAYSPWSCGMVVRKKTLTSNGFNENSDPFYATNSTAIRWLCVMVTAPYIMCGGRHRHKTAGRTRHHIARDADKRAKQIVKLIFYYLLIFRMSFLVSVTSWHMR